MTLSGDGYRLRNAMADAGFEVTPDELDEAFMEAHERIGGGVCKFCGKGDEHTELRYGMCFPCFIKPEKKGIFNMSDKTKFRLCNILALVLAVGVIVLVCVPVQGCGQAIVVIGPVKDVDGSYLRDPDGTVVIKASVKVNTVFKDLVWGDIQSESNKLRAIYPPFYIETKKEGSD